LIKRVGRQGRYVRSEAGIIKIGVIAWTKGECMVDVNGCSLLFELAVIIQRLRKIDVIAAGVAGICGNVDRICKVAVTVAGSLVCRCVVADVDIRRIP
jgi:hypothetical protein